MTETITVPLLKGAIPAACYRAAGLVTAEIALVAGLTALEMTVTAISVGTGDTDEVTFEYEGGFVPAGVVLAPCNFASFQCRCDCCAEKRCMEVIGPQVAVVDDAYFVGFLPGDMIADQFKVYSASPTEDTFHLSLTADGEAVFAGVTVDGNTTISRSQWEEPFASTGFFAEDTKFEATVTGAPEGDAVWRGLTLCILGRWFTVA